MSDSGHYNSDRKGYETKDGGLIRISGDTKVRIDIYGGDERVKGGHTRDTINYDTTTGEGSIDQHNADKSEKSSTDINCYLTTACMRCFQDEFDDNCYELRILRWFRDHFVSREDVEYYYDVAPLIVEAIDNAENSDEIYKYIYDDVVHYCVVQIENGEYDEAYSRYKDSILSFEKQFGIPFVRERLVKTLKKINRGNYVSDK